MADEVRLHVITVNIGTFNLYHAPLRALLERLEPDIVLVQETGVVDNSLGVFNIEGYKLFHRNGICGVCIYAKTDLSPSQILLPATTAEFIAIQVSWPTTSARLVAICGYRTSSNCNTTSVFQREVVRVLLHVRSIGRCILGGDFNWTPHIPNYFVNVLYEFGLTKLRTGPTHGHNTIDILFVPNELYGTSNVELLDPIEPFHRPVSCHLRTGQQDAELQPREDAVRQLIHELVRALRIRH